MTESCADLLGVSFEPGREQPSRFLSNRRVDDRSYRVGVPAVLSGEASDAEGF